MQPLKAAGTEGSPNSLLATKEPHIKGTPWCLSMDVNALAMCLVEFPYTVPNLVRKMWKHFRSRDAPRRMEHEQGPDAEPPRLSSEASMSSRCSKEASCKDCFEQDINKIPKETSKTLIEKRLSFGALSSILSLSLAFFHAAHIY